MSEPLPHGGARGTIGAENGPATALGAADWLHFAATPTFALMVWLTSVSGAQPDMLCAANPSPLSDMALMYLLMSAFHLTPWLKLIAKS